MGPMSATMATLFDAGWDLTEPLRWTDPAGMQWEPDFQADKQPFLDLVASFASKLQRLYSEICVSGVCFVLPSLACSPQYSVEDLAFLTHMCVLSYEVRLYFKSFLDCRSNHLASSSSPVVAKSSPYTMLINPLFLR